MLTIQEAAIICGVTEAAIYAAIKSGRLKAVKLYGRMVLNPADVEEYKQSVGFRNGYNKRETADRMPGIKKTKESSNEQSE